MHYSKYLTVLFLSLSAAYLNGGIDTDCVNPSPECPEPETCECQCKPDCCQNDSLYEDYAWYATAPESDYEFARENGLWGIWLPEGPPAFRPFIAVPHQVTFGVGWRFNDPVLGKNLTPVSFGDTRPFLYKEKGLFSRLAHYQVMRPWQQTLLGKVFVSPKTIGKNISLKRIII